MSIEARYVEYLLGPDNDKSPLTTDGYKFAMGQAGFPLREEVFYLHFRKGGPLFVPFDLADIARLLRPRLPNAKEAGFLQAHGYGLTPAMEQALQMPLDVWALPKGSWANQHEPVLTVRGPSFLVSWLEPLLIALHFPMQVATALKAGVSAMKATCTNEAVIIDLVAEALGTTKPKVYVSSGDFRRGVHHQIGELEAALEGDLSRAFEVGTRSMTCMAMHQIALEECRKQGINRTANVQLAYDLYMTPVGTTGHEHQERWAVTGGGDAAGFRAIRDLRPEPPSYLFDTFDPMEKGIPAAVTVMLEDRTRNSSVRFDSGDQEEQLRQFVKTNTERGTHPFYIFMDGYDHVRTKRMEHLANSLKVQPHDRHYGFGSYLVTGGGACLYPRDQVAMVYKLCKTGPFDVMKYSGTPGKSSLPGVPRVVRGVTGQRVVVQEGESYVFPMGTARTLIDHVPNGPSLLSPQTKDLVRHCRKRDL